ERIRSRVPRRTRSTIRPTLGRSTASTTPPTALKTPRSATTSQNPQPPRVAVCRKETAAVRTAVPSQNMVAKRLARKLARYSSSSARFAAQKARSTPKARRILPTDCSIPPPSPGPDEVVGDRPGREPEELPAEAAQDGVRVRERAGQDLDRERDHVREPQDAGHARDGGREERERRDPPGQEEGDPPLQLRDRRRPGRPERQQAVDVAGQEPDRGGEDGGERREAEAAGLEWEPDRGPEHGDQEPDEGDQDDRLPLVRDVVGDRLVQRVHGPGEAEVELALADPAVDVPDVPGERGLVDEHDGEEVAREVGLAEPAHVAAAGHRPPDREGDGRLGDAEDQPDHDRGAVLHIDHPPGADQRAVAAGPGAEGGGHSTSPRGGAGVAGDGAPSTPLGSPACPPAASVPALPSPAPRSAPVPFTSPSVASPANARAITSSMGGSVIDRSATGSTARSRALARATSRRGTSSVALWSSRTVTVPKRSRSARSTSRSRTSSRRLMGAIRSASSARPPS